MSDNSISVPSYRLHKQSGQAVVTLSDGFGGRRDVLLGAWRSKESRLEYARVISEWESAGRRITDQKPAGGDVAVNELLVAFMRHAETHYRHPGSRSTSELAEYKYSLRPLMSLYGASHASDFSSLSLKAVRRRMIDSGLCRGVINQRIGRIKRVFRWAVSEALVPPTVFTALQCVAGLQRGRTEAPERDPVKPVPEASIEAILPHVNRYAAAMIEVQRLTGMRPGEVCAMRACDLDTSRAVWIYRRIDFHFEIEARATGAVVRCTDFAR